MWSSSRKLALWVLAAGVAAAMPARAADTPAGTPEGFLETVKRHTLLTSTVTPSGDQNP